MAAPANCRIDTCSVPLGLLMEVHPEGLPIGKPTHSPTYNDHSAACAGIPPVIESTLVPVGPELFVKAASNPTTFAFGPANTVFAGSVAHAQLIDPPGADKGEFVITASIGAVNPTLVIPPPEEDGVEAITDLAAALTCGLAFNGKGE